MTDLKYEWDEAYQGALEAGLTPAEAEAMADQALVERVSDDPR